jgi:hypothetical protein
MQSCCFGFEQHLGRWAVFSAAFHHAERAPRGDQQPDGRVAHNQKLQNILGVDIGILATRALRARKTRKVLDDTFQNKNKISVRSNFLWLSNVNASGLIGEDHRSSLDL